MLITSCLLYDMFRSANVCKPRFVNPPSKDELLENLAGFCGLQKKNKKSCFLFRIDKKALTFVVRFFRNLDVKGRSFCGN